MDFQPYRCAADFAVSTRLAAFVFDFSIFTLGGLDGVPEHDRWSEKNRSENEADGDCRRKTTVPTRDEASDEQHDGNPVEGVSESVGDSGPTSNCDTPLSNRINCRRFRRQRGVVLIARIGHLITLADDAGSWEVTGKYS